MPYMLPLPANYILDAEQGIEGFNCASVLSDVPRVERVHSTP